MNYDIHSALEQMESNLKNVDSARQQVSNVVNACSGLISEAQRLVACIHDIMEKSDVLLTKAQGEIANLRDEVLKLENIHTTIKTAVSDINSLKNQIRTLLEELQSSQSAQDRKLEEISADVSVLQTSLQKAHDKLNSLRSEVLEKFAELETALSQATAAIQTDVQSTKSAIQSDIQQLQFKTLEQLAATQAQLDKEIKTNRYIMFVAVVLLLGILVKLFI